MSTMSDVVDIRKLSVDTVPTTDDQIIKRVT